MTRRAARTTLPCMSSHASPTSSTVNGWPADRWPGGPAETGEAALVRRLRAGDEAAFAGLIRRHHASMVRVARLYVADRSVAEEVVQETWLAVLTEIDAFREQSSIKTWIYRILVNRASSRGAREHRILPFCALGRDDDGPSVEPERFRDGAWCQPPRPWTDPERRLLSLELRDTLRTALSELPERQRAVVILRDVEGLSAQDVADLLGISDGAQRVLLHRGRTRLRAVLAHALEGDVVSG
jgi:RNA polymerase sigma-70 factor (ECF subfamily)